MAWIIYVFSLLLSYNITFGVWYVLNIILGFRLLYLFINVCVELLREKKFCMLIIYVLLILLAFILVYCLFPALLGKYDIYDELWQQQIEMYQQ